MRQLMPNSTYRMHRNLRKIRAWMRRTKKGNMSTVEIDLNAPTEQIDPVSGLDWRRMMIPVEYVVQFKRVLGKGIEVHAVLGDRILVSEIAPYTEEDATNQRLAKDGVAAKDGGPAIIVAPVHFRGDQKVVKQKPPACTGFIIQVGENVTHPLIREGGAVAFGQYAGNQFSIGTVGFRILSLDEILFVVRTVKGETMTSVHVPTRVDVEHGFSGPVAR